MPSWLQIVSTIIFYAWLFIVTYLLWRRAKKNDAVTQEMLTTLADITLKGVEPIRKAAEAAEYSAHAAQAAADAAQRTSDATYALIGDDRGAS